MSDSTRTTRPGAAVGPRLERERGLALILVLLVTAFLSALGLGVMMAVFMDRLANRNLAGSIGLLYAADAGTELAARDMARIDDWSAVLAGVQQSAFTDGMPGGVRQLAGGGQVDLTAATNLLNCGKVADCTDAQMNANSQERPWGANNPRWRLFAYGPMAKLAGLARPAPWYLAVWIADDKREEDGNPSKDADDDANGHGIVRVHAEAYGAESSRRVIEAELARVCVDDACLPGIRVQSWQERRQGLP